MWTFLKEYTLLKSAHSKNANTYKMYAARLAKTVLGHNLVGTLMPHCNSNIENKKKSDSCRELYF
jgi:hypothetical protein